MWFGTWKGGNGDFSTVSHVRASNGIQYDAQVTQYVVSGKGAWEFRKYTSVLLVTQYDPLRR